MQHGTKRYWSSQLILSSHCAARDSMPLALALFCWLYTIWVSFFTRSHCACSTHPAAVSWFRFNNTKWLLLIIINRTNCNESFANSACHSCVPLCGFARICRWRVVVANVIYEIILVTWFIFTQIVSFCLCLIWWCILLNISFLNG